MYGWEPDVVARLSRDQIRYFLHWLPRAHALDAYPVAKLAASLKNMLGGKPDPNAPAEKKGKPIPPELLYTPEEELPFYAWFDEPRRPGLTTAAARDLLEHAALLPMWAREVAPLDAAQQLLS